MKTALTAKKAGAALVALLLLAALYTGCGAPAAQEAPAAAAAAAPMPEPQATDAAWNYSNAAEYGRDAGAVSEEMDTAPAQPASAGALSGSAGEAEINAAQPDAALKIIRDVYLTIQTNAFDADYAVLQNKAAELGGYVQSSNIDGRKPEEWNEPGRNAHMVFRIPAGRLEEFLGTVQGVGEVISQQMGSEDVTSHYFDIESRVGTLQTQLERLKAILTESQTLADIIELEKEIARVQYEIESLTTDLTRIDRLVDYATVTVSLAELSTLERPAYASPRLGDRMNNALATSYNSVVDFLEGFLVFLVGALPMLPVLAIIALVVWLIVRAAGRRAKKRREEFAQKQAEALAARAAQPSDSRPNGGFSAPAAQDASGADKTAGS